VTGCAKPDHAAIHHRDVWPDFVAAVAEHHLQVSILHELFKAWLVSLARLISGTYRKNTARLQQRVTLLNVRIISPDEGPR
jgi:hypothetical protein